MLNPQLYPREAERAFLFQLALDLGKGVDEIEEFSAHEIMEWSEFYASRIAVQKTAQEKRELEARMEAMKRRG